MDEEGSEASDPRAPEVPVKATDDPEPVSTGGVHHFQSAGHVHVGRVVAVRVADSVAVALKVEGVFMPLKGLDSVVREDKGNER